MDRVGAVAVCRALHHHVISQLPFCDSTLEREARVSPLGHAHARRRRAWRSAKADQLEPQSGARPPNPTLWRETHRFRRSETPQGDTGPKAQNFPAKQVREPSMGGTLPARTGAASPRSPPACSAGNSRLNVRFFRRMGARGGSRRTSKDEFLRLALVQSHFRTLMARAG